MSEPIIAPPNPWEHFQNILQSTYNRRVRGYFRADDDDLGDIRAPAGSILRACLVVDDDSQLQALNRQLFFYFTVGAAKDLLDPVVGTPLPEFRDGAKYRPTVTLYFEQDPDSVPSGSRAVLAKISFGLRNKTHLNLTNTELGQLAKDIRRDFGSSGGYRFSKGKILCTYNTGDGLIQTKIYALNESEGKQLAQKVCILAEDPYDDDFFTVHAPKRSNTVSPGTVSVLGKQRKKPRYRPVATVRFKYASITVWPIPTPIYLVSTPWRHPNALEFLNY